MKTLNIIIIIIKIYFIINSSPKPNNKGKERLNQQQAKFGRPSLYSMFSLIDESEEAANLSYFNLIKEIFSNMVNKTFI